MRKFTVQNKYVESLFLSVFVLFLLAGCSQTADSSVYERSYTQISQDEAMEMMERDDGHIVVDVRRQDEYDAGHIPGAILIPNESIGAAQPEELPDLDQIILIYCRSGNRSKQAAQKLADMGYTNVYEFGGINTWTGDIVTDEGEGENSDINEEAAIRVKITVGDTVLYADMEDNETVRAWTADMPLMTASRDINTWPEDEKT